MGFLVDLVMNSTAGWVTHRAVFLLSVPTGTVDVPSLSLYAVYMATQKQPQIQFRTCGQHLQNPGNISLSQSQQSHQQCPVVNYPNALIGCSGQWSLGSFSQWGKNHNNNNNNNRYSLRTLTIIVDDGLNLCFKLNNHTNIIQKSIIKVSSHSR